MTILRKICLAILIGYLLLLAYWMIFGFGRSAGPVYMYNLKPFSTIAHFTHFDRFNTRTWVINLIGNIGVFIPLGLLLPMAFRIKYAKSMVIFLAGLFILEISQLISKRGSFDIDDFILNTIGFTVGYWIFKLLSMMWGSSERGNNIQ
jgi:glycopeptide antibiotics resistance protein